MSHFQKGFYYKSFLILLGLSVLLASSLHAADQTRSHTGLPSLAAIKNCLIGADSAECLDHLFRSVLKDHSTGEALQLIRRFEAEDPELRRDCAQCSGSPRRQSIPHD